MITPTKVLSCVGTLLMMAHAHPLLKATEDLNLLLVNDIHLDPTYNASEIF